MTPERYEQLNDLFHATLAQPEAERPAFLAQACGGDEALRREVDRMLVGHQQAGDFLEAPVAASLGDAPPESSFIGREFGHYRILAPLGAGGMGEVFLAQDVRLDRKVALKILPREFTQDADLVHRFEREAKAVSALNHPNILTIHEISETDGLHFIVTEYIEGQTLRQRMKHGALSATAAFDVAMQATAALHAAHRTGIIHRDIKPENLMLRPDGFLKVLDFGLARINRPQQFDSGEDSTTHRFLETHPGVVMGTLSYMSPEQARGEKVDERTDLWSLGVVLYEMLTGTRPFGGATMPDTLVAILDREPPPLTQRLPQASPELENLVAKLLAKERERRYQSAEELSRALKGLRQRWEFDAVLTPALGQLSEYLSEAPTLTNAKRLLMKSDSDSEPTRHLPAQPPVVVSPVSSDAALSIPTTAVNAEAKNKNRLLSALGALLVIALGVILWQVGWRERQPSQPQSAIVASPAANALSERTMAYSLTVQKYRDGKPYQAPFASSGQEIFENGWRFRLNFNSPQTGWLYLLNEAPGAGDVTYYLLFPIPSQNGGTAQLAAGQTMQTGWYVVGEQQGTEKFRLVWSAQPVAPLEAVKGVVNPTDQGLIGKPAERDAVSAWLLEHATVQLDIEKDKLKKQTLVRGRGDSLVHLVELEHH